MEPMDLDVSPSSSPPHIPAAGTDHGTTPSSSSWKPPGRKSKIPLKSAAAWSLQEKDSIKTSKFSDHDHTLDSSGDESDESSFSISTSIYQTAKSIIRWKQRKMNLRNVKDSVKVSEPASPSLSQKSDSGMSDDNSSIVSGLSNFTGTTVPQSRYHDVPRGTSRDGSNLKLSQRSASVPISDMRRGGHDPQSSAHLAQQKKLSLPSCKSGSTVSSLHHEKLLVANFKTLKGTAGCAYVRPTQPESGHTGSTHVGSTHNGFTRARSTYAGSTYSGCTASSVASLRAAGGESSQRDRQESIVQRGKAPRKYTRSSSTSMVNLGHSSRTAKRDAGSSIMSPLTHSQSSSSPVEQDARSSVSSVQPLSLSFSDAVEPDVGSSVSAVRPSVPSQSFYSAAQPAPLNTWESARDAATQDSMPSSLLKVFFLSCVVLLVGVAVAFYDPPSLQSCTPLDVGNLENLGSFLSDRVYGQSLAIDIVSAEMQKYVSQRKMGRVRPLVLSFHGWVGVGKTYLAQQLPKFFDPSNVKATLFVTQHFQRRESRLSVQCSTEKAVLGAISPCHFNIIILEDVDKADKETLLGLMDAIWSISNSGTPVFPPPPVVFLLVPTYLSGGTSLTKKYLRDVEEGADRESFILEDFSSKVLGESSLWLTYFQSNSLLDSVVPFLPLETRHVVECIHFVCREQRTTCGEDIVENVLERIQFHQINSTDLQVSMSGCKRVYSLVLYELMGDD